MGKVIEDGSTIVVEGALSYEGSFIELDKPRDPKAKAIDIESLFKHFGGQDIRITIEKI